MNIMKNSVIAIFMAITLVFTTSSCRGNSTKKTVEIVKKYVGKTVNATEKAHLERHVDNLTKIKFKRVKCSACFGTGQIGYSTCEACDGDGWVYKVETR